MGQFFCFVKTRVSLTQFSTTISPLILWKYISFPRQKLYSSQNCNYFQISPSKSEHHFLINISHGSSAKDLGKQWLLKHLGEIHFQPYGKHHKRSTKDFRGSLENQILLGNNYHHGFVGKPTTSPERMPSLGKMKVVSELPWRWVGRNKCER